VKENVDAGRTVLTLLSAEQEGEEECHCSSLTGKAGGLGWMSGKQH
jgi:hypothetical protein